MIPVISILDQFLPEPWCGVLRAEVLAQGFTTELIEEAPGVLTPYHTVNLKRDVSEFFIHIEQALGLKITPKLHAFRLGAENSQVHNFVHADHTCAQIAGVYYLNNPEQCQGGTAFWKHRKHGWRAMPTKEQMESVGFTLDEMKADWMNPDSWEMTTLVDMKTNRLTIYPTQAFHSRWPIEGFGEQSKPETCRLVLCLFFDVA